VGERGVVLYYEVCEHQVAGAGWRAGGLRGLFRVCGDDGNE
jgi:hypothetical protein